MVWELREAKHPKPVEWRAWRMPGEELATTTVAPLFQLQAP
jgi:hypothetical protein